MGQEDLQTTENDTAQDGRGYLSCRVFSKYTPPVHGLQRHAHLHIVKANLP
jgi:hypothetical protein